MPVAARAARAARAAGRSDGSRPIFGCSSTMSRKTSAWRRSSSATIGGCVEMVETTVTRTPRRCTASTSERKSPSPENSTMWSMCRRELHGIDRELDVHVALDLAAAGLVDEFLGRLGDDGVAVVVEPIDQRADRRIFLILDHGGVIERAQQIAARLELAQQPLVIDIEAQRFGGGVEIGAVNEQSDFFDLCGPLIRLSSCRNRNRRAGCRPSTASGCRSRSAWIVVDRDRSSRCRSKCECASLSTIRSSRIIMPACLVGSRGLPNRGLRARQAKSYAALQFRSCALVGRMAT